MKSKCNVARDLMPLVIDGVASEESQRIVTEHIAECAACAEYYADMHDELNRQAAEDEQKELEAAAKSVLRTRRLRQLVRAAILLVVAAVLFGSVAYHADEIMFRIKYVRWNGDLREEALFAKVSGYPGEQVRYVHLDSFPSGSPVFIIKFASEILDDGQSFCLQIGATYNGWEIDEQSGSGVVFSYGYEENGVWVGYSGEEYGYLPISRIELCCGENTKVLWELGDEVPMQYEVNEEINALRKQHQE